MDQKQFRVLKIVSSKVLVLPSTREGFGIVVVEANACGLPVVTTNYERNAARDLIIDGETGFLCNPSRQDVAEKILMALDKKQDMTQGCLDYASNYGWNKIAAMVEDTYEQVISLGKY